MNGDQQTGYGNEWLSQALKVRFFNGAGQPVSDAPVTFSILEGAGSMCAELDLIFENEMTVMTDANGDAQIYFFPNGYGQTLVVQATTDYYEATTPTSFTVHTSLPPPVVTIISGDGQNGYPNAWLSALRVHCYDPAGAPIENASITFTSQHGNAGLALQASGSTTASVTLHPDSNGYAEVYLKLPESFGQDIPVLVTTRASGPKKYFYEHTFPPPHFEILDGDHQSGNPTDRLSSPLQVRYVDSEGHVVPHASVHFSIVGGGGLAASSSGNVGSYIDVPTNDSGTTAVYLQLPPAYDRTIQVTAQSTSLSNTASATFSAQTTASPRMSIVSGDPQSGNPAELLATPLRIRYFDTPEGNGISGSPICFTITSGGGGLATSLWENGANTVTINSNTDGEALVYLRLPEAYNRTVYITASATRFGSTVERSFTATTPGPPVLDKVGGDLQTADPATWLPTALRVRHSMSAGGPPLIGVPVIFTILGSNGSLGSTPSVPAGTTISVPTDSNGEAIAYLQMRPAYGITQVSASVNRFGASAIVYFSESTPAAPTLSLASGNLQSAHPAEWLSAPLRVHYSAAGGSPLANHPVSFSILDGGGLLGATDSTAVGSTISVTTGDNGDAVAYLQLPAVYDRNVHLRASTTRYGSTSTVSFSESTCSPPQLTSVSGEPQTGLPQEILPTAFTVRYVDSFTGSRIAHKPVSFTVVSGGGGLAATSSAETFGDSITIDTNSDGEASVYLRLPTQYGQTIHLQAAATSFDSTPSASFTAQTHPPPRISIISGDHQNGNLVDWLRAPLRVLFQDSFNQPVANAPVSFSVSQAGWGLAASRYGSTGNFVTVTTDSSGHALAWLRTSNTYAQTATVVASSDHFGAGTLETSFSESTNATTVDIFKDTDGDGVPDLIESLRGTNPANAASSPAPDLIVDGAHSTDASLHRYATLQEAYEAASATALEADGATPRMALIRVLAGTYEAGVDGAEEAKAIVWVADSGGQVIVKSDGPAFHVSHETIIVGFAIMGDEAHEGSAFIVAPHVSLGGAAPEVRIVNTMIVERSETNTETSAGGVHNHGGNVWLVHSTMVNNNGSTANSILNQTGSLHVVNSVVTDLGSSIPSQSIVNLAGTGAVTVQNSIMAGMNGAWGSWADDPFLTEDGHITAFSSARSRGASAAGMARDIFGQTRPSGTGSDLGAEQWIDTDGDGLPDWWELRHGLNPNAADSNGNGVADTFEWRVNGTNFDKFYRPLSLDWGEQDNPDPDSASLGLQVFTPLIR